MVCSNCSISLMILKNYYISPLLLIKMKYLIKQAHIFMQFEILSAIILYYFVVVSKVGIYSLYSAETLLKCNAVTAELNILILFYYLMAKMKEKRWNPIIFGVFNLLLLHFNLILHYDKNKSRHKSFVNYEVLVIIAWNDN